MKPILEIIKRLTKKSADKVLVEEIFDSYLKSQESLQQQLSKNRSSLDGSRVLLVEDCPDQQRLTLGFLKEETREIELECNGDAALLKVLDAKNQGKPFDFVIMDLYLIDSNGIEATIKIREVDAMVSIVGITAYGTPDVEKLWKAAGCDIYLAKPFTKDQLIESLRFLKAKQFDSKASIAKELCKS